MASSSTRSTEYEWVCEIQRNIDQHATMDIYPPVCIFRAPQKLKDQNPEAFTPAVIGLGPYHHRDAQVHKMMRHKYSAIREYLKGNKESILGLSLSVISKLENENLQGRIRASYDSPLDLNANALAWMLGIDGVYLLSYLKKHTDLKKSTDLKKPTDQILDQEKRTEETTSRELRRKGKRPVDEGNTGEGNLPLLRKFPMEELKEVETELLNTQAVGDIFMMENQIPIFVLLEIEEAVTKAKRAVTEAKRAVTEAKGAAKAKLKTEGAVTQAKPEIEEIEEAFIDAEAERYQQCSGDLFSKFCKAHSPVRFHGTGVFHASKHAHLLDYLYYYIVNSELEPRVHGDHMDRDVDENEGEKGCDPAWLGGTNTIVGVLTKILESLRGYCSGTDVSKSQRGEIRSPTASQYCNKGNNFDIAVYGINSMRFEDRMAYISPMTLDGNSEVIIRNLLAYEASLGKQNVFGAYIDLMCGLIDTEDDVELLVKKKIIQTKIENSEVASLFNRIPKSTRVSKDKSIPEVMTDGLIEEFDSKKRVRAERGLLECCGKTLAWAVLVISFGALVIVGMESLCHYKFYKKIPWCIKE